MLIENPDYRKAYESIPEFKTVVDGIVAVVPLLLKEGHRNAAKNRDHDVAGGRVLPWPAKPPHGHHVQKQQSR